MASYHFASFMLVFISAEWLLFPVGETTDITEDMKRTLNQDIADYLSSFNKIKKSMSGADKESMSIVEKLIALTWIQTLAPQPRFVFSCTPMPTDLSSLHDIRKDIITRLEDIDSTVMEEALFHYIRKVHWKVADEFLEHNLERVGGSYSTAYISDLENKNYHFHGKYSKKMFLRAFIRGYVPEPLGPTYFLEYKGEKIRIAIDDYIMTTDLMGFYKQ